MKREKEYNMHGILDEVKKAGVEEGEKERDKGKKRNEKEKRRTFFKR